MTFAKVSPGHPLRIPAATFNACVEAAEAYQAEKLGLRSGEAPASERTGIVLLRNDSGAARQRFDVLTVGDPLVQPSADIQRFPSRLAFRGVTPDAGKPGRFAVLQEPIAAGALGRACLDGITPVAIDVIAASDPMAEVVTGQAGALRSGTSGSALILWVESGTGWRQAVVRLLGPGGTSSASGERLEITVTQPLHGFQVGHAVYADPSGRFAKAEADIPERCRVVGVVRAVADSQTFTLVLAGRVSGFTTSLYSLVPGATYYLRSGYAGMLTTDPGLNSVPVFSTGVIASDILVGNQPTIYRPSVTHRVYQTNHGFTVGTVIGGNGSGLGYVKAIATPGATSWAAPVGVVSTVIDSNAFVYVSHGIVTGVGSLIDYTPYYLSDTTAGAITATPPAVPIPIGFCMGQSYLFVHIQSHQRRLTIGSAQQNGLLRVQGSGATGDAVVIDASLVTTAAKKLYLREVDVCSGGVAKKMLLLASDPY